jgi:hypothetical protein
MEQRFAELLNRPPAAPFLSGFADRPAAPVDDRDPWSG